MSSKRLKVPLRLQSDQKMVLTTGAAHWFGAYALRRAGAGWPTVTSGATVDPAVLCDIIFDRPGRAGRGKWNRPCCGRLTPVGRLPDTLPDAQYPLLSLRSFELTTVRHPAMGTILDPMVLLLVGASTRKAH